MKRLFILFLVAIMLAGCGCRPIVNHDVDGQIMLLTKKAEEKIKKIKEIEKKAEEKIKKIKEIEKKAEEKIKKIKEIEKNAEEKIKKIKEIEKNAEEKIKKIKEIEKNAEEKIKKIKEIEKNAEGKLNKKSGSGQQETPIKETETEVDEPKIHMSFSKYIYFSAIITGSTVAFIGYKTSNYTAVVVGLLLAGAGAFGGIKRLLETSDSKEGKDE